MMSRREISVHMFEDQKMCTEWREMYICIKIMLEMYTHMKIME